MLDWLTGMTNEGIVLMRLVIVLIAIVSISAVWYQTKALVPVLGSVLVAGVAIWATSVAGIAKLEQWISSDANAVGPTTESVLVDDLDDVAGDASLEVIEVRAGGQLPEGPDR